MRCKRVTIDITVTDFHKLHKRCPPLAHSPVHVAGVPSRVVAPVPRRRVDRVGRRVRRVAPRVGARVRRRRRGRRAGLRLPVPRPVVVPRVVEPRPGLLPRGGGRHLLRGHWRDAQSGDATLIRLVGHHRLLITLPLRFLSLSLGSALQTFVLSLTSVTFFFVAAVFVVSSCRMYLPCVSVRPSIYAEEAIPSSHRRSRRSLSLSWLKAQICRLDRRPRMVRPSASVRSYPTTAAAPISSLTWAARRCTCPSLPPSLPPFPPKSESAQHCPLKTPPPRRRRIQ